MGNQTNSQCVPPALEVHILAPLPLPFRPPQENTHCSSHGAGHHGPAVGARPLAARGVVVRVRRGAALPVVVVPVVNKTVRGIPEVLSRGRSLLSIGHDWYVDGFQFNTIGCVLLVCDAWRHELSPDPKYHEQHTRELNLHFGHCVNVPTVCGHNINFSTSNKADG